MDRLKSLLNIETIAAKSDINGELENIAKILMNESDNIRHLRDHLIT